MVKDIRGDVASKNSYFDISSYVNKNPGPYLGMVKSNSDPLKMGRLGVNIMSLTNTDDPTFEQLTWCSYLSPFYGAKSPNAVSSTDPFDHKVNSHSYGMWMVPPDIDTTVMVMFVEGKQHESSAFWLGCVQQPQTNQQIPGLASSRQTSVKAIGDGAETSKKADYGTDVVPAGEVNRKIFEKATIGKYNTYKLPIDDISADVLRKQGLISDRVRGTTTSSAQREAPSQVFGFNTPGRIRPDSTESPIGIKGEKIRTDRGPGHSFVMDDGDVLGSNQLVRLRTTSGHQFLMHDTEGIIYIANGSGNAWIEMNKDGRIDLYSHKGINFRTEGDFNLHSDGNINFHAANSIRMSATNEIIKSSNYLLNLGEQGVLTSSQNGGVRTYGQAGISSYTDGSQLHGAGQNVHLAGSQVHFNSVGASQAWGPKWMTKNEVGMTPRAEGDVELTRKDGNLVLQASTREGGTETTVHRFVTHEPMMRISTFSSEGVLPIDYDDKKMWSKLVDTPGTVEWAEHQNRLSSNETIRLGQFQSDLEKYLKSKMGSSTDSKKARLYANEFIEGYDETYRIVTDSAGSFDISKSISNRIKNSATSQTIKNAKDNVQSTLTTQVIESLSDKGTKLFKDNIFVNNDGKLFTIGNSVIAGNTNLSTIVQNTKNAAVSSVIGESVSGVIKSTSLGSVMADASQITNVYNNVMSGKIVNSTQITSISQKFTNFFSRSRGVSLHGTGGQASSIMANLGIAKKAVGSWARGSVRAIGRFFKF